MLNRPQNCRPRLGRPIGRLCSHSPPPLPCLLSVLSILSVLSVLSLALADASDPCMCAFEPLSPVQCTLIRVYYGVPRPSAQRGLPKLVCYPCLDHSLCRLLLSLVLSLALSFALSLALSLSQTQRPSANPFAVLRTQKDLVKPSLQSLVLLVLRSRRLDEDAPRPE